MPDNITTCQVTQIQIGEKLMAQLLSSHITVNLPNEQNPTHQFQISLAPEVKKLIEQKPPQSKKQRKKKSR